MKAPKREAPQLVRLNSSISPVARLRIKALKIKVKIPIVAIFNGIPRISKIGRIRKLMNPIIRQEMMAGDGFSISNPGKIRAVVRMARVENKMLTKKISITSPWLREV